MRNPAAKAPLLHLALLASACLVLFSSTAAAQCAMCKEALNPNQGTFSLLTNGMFWSILFMLGVPFTMAALIVTMMIKAGRKSTSPTAASSPATDQTQA